jgi:(S)-mandelate dehydrogenase
MLGLVRASEVAGAQSIMDLRGLARRRLPRAVFDFFDGGSEDEQTLAENRAAFVRTKLIPRVLNDVSSVDLSTTILGATSALPICVGPTGAAGFGGHGTDVNIARAAAGVGIPYALSTSATASIERIKDNAPAGRLWFQVYILKQRDFTNKLIDRARDAGYEAIMVTVDLAVGGKRERDLRNHFGIPFAYTPKNVCDFASRPLWALSMLQKGTPVFENLSGFVPQGASASQVGSSVGRNYDPSFDWEALKAMRDRWPRKMLVKGISHPADAERLVKMGIDCVVVSNHGGRQLDGSIAALDALPAVVQAVAGKAEVIVDGGVRRGGDVVKALALGAKAVIVGRATLYGACAGGEAGAKKALAILTDELRRTMQLCGITRVDQITSDLIAKRSS